MLLDALGERALGENVKRILMLVAATGFYTLTGEAISAIHAAKIAATTGFFKLANENAGIVAPTRNSPVHPGLLAAASVLGSVAVVQGPVFQGLTGATGLFSVAGQSNSLLATRKLLLGTGAFIVTGENGTLRHLLGFVPNPVNLLGIQSTPNLQGGA